MSSQQPMFSPRENNLHQQNNTDPREQSREQQSWQGEIPGMDQTPYIAGYSGTVPPLRWMSDEGEKVFPPKPQPTPPWQWIVGALVVLVLAAVIWAFLNSILGSVFLVLGLAVAAIAASQFFVRRIVMPPRIFMLEGRPALIIRNPAGSLRIHSGVTNTVEVMATKYIYGWFARGEEGAIDATQDGNTIRVTSGSNYRWSPLGGLRYVNLDITVPEQCDIQVDGSAGSIRIEGISGQVKGATSAGTIHVQQTDLKGQSSLTTSAGTIHVQQAIIEGQSSLTTNMGTIHVQQATLKGWINFQTSAGTIYFAGELDPQGSYRFGTNMGSIDVVLPGDSAFTLAAATDLGSVHNQFGSTTVGPAPHARLELRTNLGSVNVRRG
jgi:hypothetical protein